MSALRDFFLDPAPGQAAADPHPPGSRPSASRPALGRPHAAAASGTPALPAGVAVLCPAAHARAIGGGVGLLLARRARARAALVVVWAEPHRARPAAAVGARPAARRLAATLAGRGLEVRATGMLTVVTLPADPVHAPAAAARAIAAAGAAPSVLVLGQRDAGFDVLLSEQDRVLVAGPPDVDAALHELALAGLASVARDLRGSRIAPSAAARTLAASGTWVAPAMRRALGEALQGLEP